MKRYQYVNDFYRNRWGERVLKIGIDAGFTCPNRDGTCGIGGCLFCGEEGAGEHLNHMQSIAQQVNTFLQSYRGQRANRFLVYFQNHTNTYDTVEHLKEKYDAALVDERIVGIAIATRPDCITPEIVQLLASYQEKYYVQVELGLQTASDCTAQKINRGYATDILPKAVQSLRSNGIDVVVHVMVGLPGETREDVLNTISFLNQLDIQGIKIHSTYVIRNTRLAEMYGKREYIPLSLEEYIETVGEIIARLRKDIVIHRLSGDAPKDMLIAPEWNCHKKWILNGIEKYLKEKDIWQGKMLDN